MPPFSMEHWLYPPASQRTSQFPAPGPTFHLDTHPIQVGRAPGRACPVRQAARAAAAAGPPSGDPSGVIAGHIAEPTAAAFRNPPPIRGWLTIHCMAHHSFRLDTLAPGAPRCSLVCLQYDFQHRLLAFLYASARAPLSNHYSGCAFVDSLEAQASIRCCRAPHLGLAAPLQHVCCSAHRFVQGVGGLEQQKARRCLCGVAITSFFLGQLAPRLAEGRTSLAYAALCRPVTLWWDHPHTCPTPEARAVGWS